MKKTFFFICFCLFFQIISAQETEVFRNETKNYKKALKLFNRKNYKASSHFFTEEANTTTSEEIKEKALYYGALSAIYSNELNADKQMESFLQTYPTSPFSKKAKFFVADYYFNNGNIKQALAWYNTIQSDEIPESQKDKYNFQKGYALFSQGDKNQSKEYFKAVSKDKDLKSKSAYYLGYMAYDTNDYSNAETYFEQVNDEELSKNLSYYQADMSFKQGNFEKALQEGLSQLQKTKNQSEISEINKIIGESYFNLKKYNEALPYLKAYKGKNGKFSPTDFYYLGYIHYKQNDFHNAINHFNKIIDGKNSVAQNAYYHLAECYLKTDQKQQALNAFKNASEMDFSPEIKKDAKLNYTRLSYEIGNPYQSVPSVILDFIKAYPEANSLEMKGLLVDSYITSGNYAAALSILENSKDLQDRKIYEQVAFYRALELYSDQKYQESLRYFEKAGNAQNQTLKARSEFWQGEVNYILNHYEKAENHYNNFKNNSNSSKTEEFKGIDYALGYAYFNQKKYEKAIESFNKYLTLGKSNKTAEVNIRIADSYFILAKYWQAMEAYNQVIGSGGSDVDYAAFQKAISYGFVDRVPKKIEELTNFVKKYPTSNLRPDAIFELGNTFVSQGETEKALPLYKQIQKEYPAGGLVSRSMLREALVYYNSGQNEKSISVLKEITDKYPNTSEALQAVHTAKLVYVDMGKVSEYANWAKSLGYVQVSDSELDNASFEAAEKQFLQQNKQEAILNFQKYLKEFPHGANRASAEFNLANLYLEQGEKKKAIPLFESLIKQGKNEFTESALTSLSQIYLDENSPKKALPVLLELENLSSLSQNLVFAQSNLMKIYFEEKNYAQTIVYAEKVLSQKIIDNRIKNDANLFMARSLMATSKEKEAEKFYAEIRKTATGVVMAEAVYYQAYFQNKAKNYEKSNQTIQKLAKDFGGYKEFSGRGLILMADNFAKLQDHYQSTYILNSVIENFTDYPEIVNEAKRDLVSKK